MRAIASFRKDVLQGISKEEETLLHLLGEKDESVNLSRISERSLSGTRGVLLDFAKENKVECSAASGVVRYGLQEAESKWERILEQSSSRVKAYLDELDRISILLHEVGVCVALIEHGSIARTIYYNKCVGCFESADLDVLVRKEDRPAIDEVLGALGYVPTLRHSEGLESEQKGWQVYKRQLENGILFHLNVQWVPVLRRWLEVGQAPSLSHLLGRSSFVAPSTTTKVRVLSPEDNLLVLALHTASHSYIRSPGLRLHLDIDRWLTNIQVDWSKFIELVYEHRVRKTVFLSLAIPKALFGTPVPMAVLSKLVPREKTQRKLLTRIVRGGVFNPGQRKFTALEFVGFEVALNDGGSAVGLFRALFPRRPWLQEEFPSHYTIPYWQLAARRLARLGTKRGA